MAFTFSYTSGTKFETLHTEGAPFNFVNLKNKAEGARRYGYRGKVDKATNPAGFVAYRSDYQTTLNGSHYQSSKASKWVETEAEARALLAKTVAGAIKRYTKLATNPANKIEALAE